MDESLSILFVSSEIYPFAKVGGIADVSFSLPLALREAGADARVMMPKYGCISERKNKIHEINRLKEMPVPIGNATDPATIKSSSISNPRAKSQAYITTNQKYFDSKKGIYGNRKTGKSYPDNDERFIFFCRSVIETCLLLKWFPDVIHCNDWQTGLIAAYAKAGFPEEFADTKIVFTIHNIREQGEFPMSAFKKTGLPAEVKDVLTHKRKINFLKAGIYYADYVTTVSETYAEEISTDAKVSGGLNDLIMERKKEDKFKGILNGIDSWIWNPKTDKVIKKKLGKDFEAFKTANKKALLERFELEYDENIPVIGMTTRLDKAKGLPLFIKAADKLFEENLQLVLLGDGDTDIKNELRRLQKKYPDKFGLLIEFDENLAHQIEAGSDFFLMPSQYEACGLNSMYSLTYGALPIVRGVGGLTEIVEDYDEKNRTGNGFVFEKYGAADLMNAVKKALKVFENKEELQAVVENARSKDYSWKEQIEHYADIYETLTNKK